MGMKLGIKHQFAYIENGEERFIEISDFQSVMDSMSDDEFIDFMIAAYSAESMAFRNL